MLVVPEEFVHWRIRLSGERGRTWVASLPQRVAELCEYWGLRVDDDRPRHGAVNLVVLVSRDAAPCVLRICWPEHGLEHEVVALRAWGGRGAVRLIDVHPQGDAVLLERLDAGRTLQGLPLDAAAEAAGSLIGELTVPAPPGLPRLTERLARLRAEGSADDDALGQPIPRRWLLEALELAHSLDRDDSDLVHGDLHYGNVLADRDGNWCAIDPKPVSGDPAYSVPELMWTRCDELRDAADIRRLVRRIADAAGLDPGRAAGWTMVRAVDYWLWGLAHGLTEDPVRCQRLVAALADR
jgi:streptomycin 6-kinase